MRTSLGDVVEEIVIVGAGALGSHVAQFLRNRVECLKVVDFDRIEAKNVDAQFHGRQGLTKNKARSLQQMMISLFGTAISSIPHKLQESNINEIFRKAELVIDCTDNFEARSLIRSWPHCPILHAALSGDATFGRVMWSNHGFDPDSEGEEGAATCEDGAALPFFAQVAALTAQVAQQWLEVGKKQSFQITPTSLLRIA